MLKKLKALYVNIYLTVALIIVGYAIWQLQLGGDWLTWTGVLLSAAPLLLFISFIMVKPVAARTSANLIEAHIPIAIGVLLALYGSYNHGTALPAVLVILAYAGFLTYVFWYSHYGRESNEQLQVGRALPAFSLKDVDGKMISSGELCNKPSVIMFYRGNWCPLCMAQIKEVAASYHQLEKLGVQVILVSPQPHENTQSLASKFDVNFRFMTDENNAAATALGIVADFGIPTGMQALGYQTEAPMPTVIITDANGKVIWTHETDNYRVRPEPETFIEVLQAL